MRLRVLVAAVALAIPLMLWLTRAERRTMTRQEAEAIATRALDRYSEARRLDRARFSASTLLEDDPACAWMFRYDWSGTPSQRVFVCIDDSGNAELSLQEGPTTGT